MIDVDRLVATLAAQPRDELVRPLAEAIAGVLANRPRPVRLTAPQLRDEAPLAGARADAVATL